MKKNEVVLTSETYVECLGKCKRGPRLLDDVFAWHFEASYSLHGPNGQLYYTGYHLCLDCGEIRIYERGDGTIVVCNPEFARILD